MDDRIKKAFILFAVILVVINAFVTHLASSGAIVNPSGQSLDLLDSLNTTYDQNKIVVDINSVDLGDANKIGAGFSKTTTAPTDPLSMGLFFWKTFANVFGLLFNILFQTQVYVFYLFNSFGAVQIGWVIISVITVIELFGLVAIAGDILSIFTGGGKFF